jgi:hypothetical protein
MIAEMIRSIRVVVLALGLTLLLSVSAQAGGPAEQRGDCVGGPGEWRLVVQREGPATLRIRFELKDLVAGQSWQIFLSDNGVGIFSGTKEADNGDLRVRKLARDRSGRDRIAATAVNVDSGATCGGSVRL